jgi:hypothetical protein
LPSHATKKLELIFGDVYQDNARHPKIRVLKNMVIHLHQKAETWLAQTTSNDVIMISWMLVWPS